MQGIGRFGFLHNKIEFTRLAPSPERLCGEGIGSRAFRGTDTPYTGPCPYLPGKGVGYFCLINDAFNDTDTTCTKAILHICGNPEFRRRRLMMTTIKLHLLL
jgi:hypothetical protein